MTNCPACEEPVPVPTDAIETEIVNCGACSTELEVVQLDPLQLALAPEIEEDWGE